MAQYPQYPYEPPYNPYKPPFWPGGPAAITVLPPTPQPIDDTESQWPPPGSPVSDLSGLPPHVRRTLNRGGIGVATATQQELDQTARENYAGKLHGRTAAAFYDYKARVIRLRDEYRHELFSGRTPSGSATPRTSSARHEAGHALDAMMRVKPWLSSSSRRFQNICRKYQAGTPGGGGGMGEFVLDPYFKNCDELYATLLGVYYNDLERGSTSLQDNDQQAFEFMQEVDRGLRMSGAPKGAPIVPPMAPLGSM